MPYEPEPEAQRARMTGTAMARVPAGGGISERRPVRRPSDAIDTHTHIHRNAPALFATLKMAQ